MTVAGRETDGGGVTLGVATGRAWATCGGAAAARAVDGGEGDDDIAANANTTAAPNTTSTAATTTTSLPLPGAISGERGAIDGRGPAYKNVLRQWPHEKRSPPTDFASADPHAGQRTVMNGEALNDLRGYALGLVLSPGNR